MLQCFELLSYGVMKISIGQIECFLNCTYTNFSIGKIQIAKARIADTNFSIGKIQIAKARIAVKYKVRRHSPVTTLSLTSCQSVWTRGEVLRHLIVSYLIALVGVYGPLFQF